MRLLLVLRLFREGHAVEGVEAVDKCGKQRGKLIYLNVERRHPAIRNIAEYMHSTGKIPRIREGEVLSEVSGNRKVVAKAPASVYWCEVESNVPISAWLRKREVELVIAKEDFDVFSASIRLKSGTPYIEACEAYAKTLAVNAKRPISYIPPRISSASQFNRKTPANA